MLSRGASALYRRVLRSDLHTFTSCFRVYRRSAVVDIDLDNAGFLGVAELFARLVQRGERIVEHPATLDVRVFGQSKMKTARAVGDHLKLLAGLVRDPRPDGRRPPPAASSAQPLAADPVASEPQPVHRHVVPGDSP